MVEKREMSEEREKEDKEMRKKSEWIKEILGCFIHFEIRGEHCPSCWHYKFCFALYHAEKNYNLYKRIKEFED